MQNTREWAEGYVEIDIGEGVVDFGLFHTAPEELYADLTGDEEKSYSLLPVINYDYFSIPFLEFRKIATDTQRNIKNNIYARKTINGEVLMYTE